MHEPIRKRIPPVVRKGGPSTLSVSSFFVVSILASVSATEYVAWALHWSSWLGAPVLGHFYQPFKIFVWLWEAYDPLAYQHVTPLANHVLLNGSIALGAGFLLAWIVATIVSGPIKKKTNAILDSAHFATPKEVRRSPLLKAKSGPIIGAYPIKRDTWVPLRYDGELGISYTESPGGGKTSGFLKTNLLIPLRHKDADKWDADTRRCHTYGEEPSLVLLDIRGDLFAGTSGYQEKMLGKDVLRLEPFTAASGLASYNPLWTIRLGSAFEYDDCYAKTLSIVDSQGKGLTSYWDRAALSFGAACIGKLGYIALNTGRPEAFSLPGLVDYVTSFPTIDDLINDILSTDDDPHSIFQWVDELRNIVRVRPWIASAARAMAAKALEEKSGVYGSFIEFLALYRGDVLRQNISTSTFSFHGLANGKKPAALYLTVPPTRLEDLRPYLRMIIDDGLRELTSEGGLLHGRSIRPHQRSVIFGLDEMAALRYLDRIENSAGFLRGYGVLLWLIWQSRAQQHRYYSENELLSETMGVLLFGAPKSLEASKTLSDMLGEESLEVAHENHSGKRFGSMLDHKQEQIDLMGRPVLTPFEVREMPSDHLIAFVNGLSLYLQKFFYFKQPELVQRSKLTPSASSAALLTEIPFHTSVRRVVGDADFALIGTSPAPNPSVPQPSAPAVAAP